MRGTAMRPTGGLEQEANTLQPLRILFFQASGALGFAWLIALGARISWPIPGTPVPASLQVAAVLLAGGLLGPWGGVSAVSVYLLAGAAGAPIFALGGGIASLVGPTGGYLAGFLPAAWIAGWTSRSGSRRWTLVAGFLAAVLALHLCGWVQLAALAGGGAALKLGVVPFLAFDAAKALLAAAMVGGVRLGSDRWSGTARRGARD
jgi:biotin transport system substrate-specific component